MVKNNFFDKNQIMNDNIFYGSQKFDVSEPSYVVNLDILSSGVKSNLDIEKVGSDTRPYFEYHK